MSNHFSNFFKKCFASTGGSTALEFAIVFPVFIFLLMGTIEYSLILYAASVVDGAVSAGAREGRTGSDGGLGSRVAYTNQIIQSRIQPLMDPAQLQITEVAFANFAAVTPVAFNNCSNTGTPPLCSSMQSLGNETEIVQYAATYQWHIFTPFLSSLIGNNGVFTLTSSALVQNEPFGHFGGTTNPNHDPVPTVVPSIAGSAAFPSAAASFGGGSFGPPNGHAPQ